MVIKVRKHPSNRDYGYKPAGSRVQDRSSYSDHEYVVPGSNLIYTSRLRAQLASAGVALRKTIRPLFDLYADYRGTTLEELVRASTEQSPAVPMATQGLEQQSAAVGEALIAAGVGALGVAAAEPRETSAAVEA